MKPGPGFLVALVGADGAGKSTITELVARRLPMPASRAYLGDDPPPEVPVLPTTRWLRRRWAEPASGSPATTTLPPPAPESAAETWAVRFRRALSRTTVGLSAMAEEWHQVRRAQARVRAGEIVLLDRHFFYDYYFHHVVVRAPVFIDRVHGRWVARVLPRPELVICLDAPAEVLYQRQPEGTFAQRVVRRSEYLRMADAVGLQIIDATRPRDEVVDDVTRLVLAAAEHPGKP